MAGVLRYMMGFVGLACVGPGAALSGLVGPLQLRIFCDSFIKGMVQIAFKHTNRFGIFF